MALIDALIDKVADRELRQALRDQVDSILNKQSFGLVYQQHKPETVELPRFQVRKGCKVRAPSKGEDLYLVERVNGETVTIATMTDEPKRLDISREQLVVVREFGEPIYPGLHPVGQVSEGGEKRPHVVINAENFHALETLLYTHEGQIDCIYIDPPYNTGSRDWKYNNDYVDGVDQFRHSKWLAFMERRLLLARRLLKESGVLVVTIDEHEVDNLGLLLRQTLPEAEIQRVTIVINPKGNNQTQFSRVDEYAFFCFHGDANVVDGPDSGLGDVANSEPVWGMLMRRGSNSLRKDRPTMFYPIIVEDDTGRIVGAGDPLDPGTPRASVKAQRGTRLVWPIRTDGSEGRWQIGRDRLLEQVSEGTAKVGARGGIQYVSEKGRKGIKSGAVEVTGTAHDGSLLLRWNDRTTKPKTVWFRPAHNAATYGTDLLTNLLGERDQFPFPKSVYATKDAIRAAVGDRPDAVVLDFFAGSGTTMHAVALLNAEDGGERQSILVTNNEVSSSEAADLGARGVKAGDPEWEQLGIFHHVTKPRVTAAITGKTPSGSPVGGDYLGTVTPMADGLPENAAFFELTYEDPDLIGLGRKFQAVAPLLWMKAGGRGRIIDKPVKDWTVPVDAFYGVLFNCDKWRDFVDEISFRADEIAHAFVVTDSTATFQQILLEVPSQVECTQLYADYLRTFEINTEGRA
ncbi:DNA methyltransferase [Nocardioides sp. SOB44]|uniref:DNA methyltransferase n=1 Tax=Nocardioides cremeus TaxID=3058044 RepID=A0ABT8TLS8_9ACTN|nr:DNA methyltransferase [Nocardioides cremeus]MDO3394911.1 DNA methyltransferase [Nocardioides cremeus]